MSLVTGSSSGIGAATAKELAAGGATVAVHFRGNAEGADAVVEAIHSSGGKCGLYQADVSHPDQAADLVKRVQADLGGLDILVNNAGTTRDQLLLSMKEEDWDVVLTTNLKSVYAVTQGRAARDGAQALGADHQSDQRGGHHGAGGPDELRCKQGGIIGFTKSLAREVASRNITVNAVAPGFIPTSLTDVLPDEAREQILRNTPLGRMGTPEEVAWAVAFLADERSGFITGPCPDGGRRSCDDVTERLAPVQGPREETWQTGSFPIRIRHYPTAMTRCNGHCRGASSGRGRPGCT